MASYKLTYFDARGYAELSRLLFALKGQDFEDVRFTRDDWPTYKPTSPYGQAPFLEVDGKKIGQSQAVANYLAREFGFYGGTNAEMSVVDTVLGFRMDFYQWRMRVRLADSEAKKEEIMKEMYDVKIPQFLGAYEKLLKESGTGYFVGDKIGYADVAAFDSIDRKFDEEKMSKILEGFPLFAANRKRVSENDKIKTYLANRKNAEN